jgi:molybdate transport system permease protein
VTRWDLKNRVFTTLLGSLLAIFLVGVVLVLSANIVYLAKAERPDGATGWQLLRESLRDSENHFAIKLSVFTAALTTLVSLIIAVPAAYILSRHRLPGGTIVDTVLDLPIVLPPPVMGLSLLILFNTEIGRSITELTPMWFVSLNNKLFSLATGGSIEDTKEWVYSTRGIVLAQFFVACSFGVRAIKATFDTIGRRHEDVARTLGCTRLRAFFLVVLPMARAGIVASAVMIWARAIAEFGPILFFCGATAWKTEVMPIAMFLNYSGGDIEPAIALVLTMVAISAVTLLTFKKLGGQGYLW